jgi:hypothetical protein
MVSSRPSAVNFFSAIEVIALVAGPDRVHFATVSDRIAAAMSPLTLANPRLCAAASASKPLPDTGSLVTV